MLLLQQISNDAKVMQTKAEADLKSAATRSDRNVIQRWEGQATARGNVKQRQAMNTLGKLP